MRNYGNYGNYDEGGYGRRGVPGSGRGRYNAGRRGYREGGSYGHYYPEEMIDQMREYYMDYNEGREQYNRGNSYNGEEQMIQATEGIMKNITEIVKELSESDNPQVMQIIQMLEQLL